MSKIQIESNSQLKSNHIKLYNSCIYHVKDTNRKQFTTLPAKESNYRALYLSCQRYKSKAIHNLNCFLYWEDNAVFIMSKIQIESNSQLLQTYDEKSRSCIYHVKDTNRKQFTTTFQEDQIAYQLYLSCQRYKSKAIHNKIWWINLVWSAVFIMSKIQIESNSQQVLASLKI